jgi:hypothetical protein
MSRPGQRGYREATRHQGQLSGRVVLEWAEGQRVAVKLFQVEDGFSDHGPPQQGYHIRVALGREERGKNLRELAGPETSDRSRHPFMRKIRSSAQFLISERETRCHRVDSEPS